MDRVSGRQQKGLHKAYSSISKPAIHIRVTRVTDVTYDVEGELESRKRRYLGRVRCVSGDDVADLLFRLNTLMASSCSEYMISSV